MPGPLLAELMFQFIADFSIYAHYIWGPVESDVMATEFYFRVPDAFSKCSNLLPILAYVLTIIWDQSSMPVGGPVLVEALLPTLSHAGFWFDRAEPEARVR